MKKILTLSAALTLGALMLAGCPKAPDAVTDAGNKVGDAAASAGGKMADAGNKMSGAAADMGNKMGDAGKKMGAAVAGAVPSVDAVKSAIMGESDLKDAKINVAIKDSKVVLTGQVKSDALKTKAGECVTKVAPGVTVQNMILVK